MSKKVKDETEATDLVMADKPEMEAEPAPPEKAWTETVWGTHVRWACRLCPFDTLDGEEAAAEHFRVEHAPPPPPVVERIQVYDRWGNAV